MGGGSSTASNGRNANLIAEKIPEMPTEPECPNSPVVTINRSRSGVTEGDGESQGPKNGKGRRRSSVKSSNSSKEDFDIEKLRRTPISPKLTEDTKKQVVESIQHFFFPTTADADTAKSSNESDKVEIDLFLKALQRETSPTGSYPMKEGEVGTKLYILESGDVEVTIGGTFIRNMGPGSLFGELALIYDAPRSASIKCTNDCVFWVLSRTNYQGILNLTRSHDVSQQLMECPEISNELGYVGRSKLLKGLQIRSFEKGEVIFEQGSIVDMVMIIESGVATLRSDDGSGNAKAVAYDDLYLNNSDEEHADKGTTRETFLLSEGCIIGIPAITAHIHDQSSGLWELSSGSGGSQVSCPFRLVANDKMRCAVFSIATFDTLRKQDPPHEMDLRRMQSNTDGNEEFGVIKNFDISQMKLHLITSQGSRSAHAVGVYSNGKEYSIKYVSKANLISKTNKEIESFFTESDMLHSFHSRFIQKMCCVFETPTALAFATEELDRGDLFSAIYENPMYPITEGGIPSELVKFYTCAIVSAISYLHRRQVSYRDLKPENCMIDSHGYIKLTEFAFAKKIPFYGKNRWGRKILHVRSTTICGTPEYMAPEFILCTGNDHGVDLWSTGILLYEMIKLNTPFAIADDNNVQELFKRITRVKLVESEVLYLDPSMDEKMDQSPFARQLVAALLKGSADARLGYRDGEEILDHPLFEGFDVSGVTTGSYVPSFIPPQCVPNGISVDDEGEAADPSSFFDTMSPKEEKRFAEVFHDRSISTKS